MYQKLIFGNFLTLLSILILLLNGCQKTEMLKSKEKPAVPVNAAISIVKDIPVYVDSVGTLEPSFYLEIRPQVSGVLETIFVQQGDWVTIGTQLFKIDSKAYEIKVKEAEAQVLMDRASHEAAFKKMDRYKGLAQKDLIAQIEWDEIQEQATKAQANLAADEAKLEAAKLDLERCTLRATAEGRVGRYDLSLGSLISKEKVLTSLSRMNPLVVNFTLTEKEFSKLPQGELTIEARLLCGTDCSIKGVVTFLDSRFDAKTGLLFIRGELDNSVHHLHPGQRVSIRVPVAIDAQKILIPHKAVRYNQQGPYVYVISPESTLEFRQILMGDAVEEQVIVLEGVSPGEQVVTSGHSRLSPGLKVEIQT